MTFELVVATVYLTCGAVMLFLGLVLLRENPRQAVNRATAAMLVFGGLGPILGAYQNLAVSSGETGNLFAQFAFLWEFFFPSALLFALVFPTRHRLLLRWPKVVLLLFVPHAFHVVLVALASRPDWTSAVDWASRFPIAQGFASDTVRALRVLSQIALSIHVRFFALVNFAMAVASWWILHRSASRTTHPKLKAQVRLIASGLGFSLGLYSGGALVPEGLGIPVKSDASLFLVTVSLLVAAGSLVVAIVRMGFLDVRFIVRRGLVYGLASGVIVALYLLVGKGIDRVAGQVVGQTIPFFETTFLVLSLFLLQPVLSWIERLVDRASSRNRADVRNALTRLSEQVSLVLDPAEVCSLVAVTIRREMVLSQVAVAAREASTGFVQRAVATEVVERESVWSLGPYVFQALEGRRESLPVRELVESSPSEEGKERLREAFVGQGNSTVIPLMAPTPDERDELVGAIFLGPKITESRLTFDERSLVALIAHQVAISLQNSLLHRQTVAARVLEEEIATARGIQEQLLPKVPPRLSGWELCASNRPSREIGGDYHDFLSVPSGELGIAIGDVSGKGIPAALLMSNLQAALRVRTLRSLEIERVVSDVNVQVCQNTGPESFISFFWGVLRPECGTLTFTNAGHNAPIVVRRDGSVELLEDGGLLLGVFPEATYTQGELQLAPGDFVAMYTDGLTEATNPGEDLFSEERLVETLIRERSESANEVHARVLNEVSRFQGGRPPDDDLTLIVLKRTGDSTT